MAAKTIVKKHPRVIKGKVYKVNSHKRIKKRPLGKKISYKTAGLFLTAMDENGNLRGSKIIKNSKTNNKSSTKEMLAEEKKSLATKFYNGEITYSEYYKKLNSLN